MLSSPTACVKICKFLSVLQSYSPEIEIRVSVGWVGGRMSLRCISSECVGVLWWQVLEITHSYAAIALDGCQPTLGRFSSASLGASTSHSGGDGGLRG
jgi:hypothetical protein